MTDLTVQDYRALIREALISTVDSDTDAPNIQRLYTPDTHRRALQPDVTIVRGARGVGKTVWYKSLQEDSLRQVAADSYQIPTLSSIRPVQGYGSARSPENYPNAATLRMLLAQRVEPLDIWMAVLLKALGNTEIAAKQTWKERVQWAADSPEEVDVFLTEADRRAGQQGERVLVLFDALDRLHDNRRDADVLARGILRLALDLRLGAQNIRAKVFIRPDMLDSALLDFTDSSKLVANAAELTWSNTNLFGLFFHYLGNGPVNWASTFRAATGTHWRVVESGLRYITPERVAADRTTQQDIFIEIAGPYMGTNHRKGHTYSWLPNHLMDGAEQVSPRSFLSALSKAAELTADTYSGHDRPLHYEAIRSGVQHASRIRVQEIREDIPWVASVVESLEGLQVPIERGVIEDRWDEYNVFESLRSDYGSETVGDDEAKTGPQSFTSDGLISELVELGVMSYRRDGRIDLPDVYRIAFNIGRKGGVPRVAR